MADHLVPSLLESDFLHTDLSPFQCLDEFNESSFNHITNNAQEEQGVVTAANLENDMVLPPCDVQEELLSCFADWPAACCQYSPSCPAALQSNIDSSACQSEETCSAPPKTSVVSAVDKAREESSEEKANQCCYTQFSRHAPRRKAPQREREPKIAFVVESSMDHLPDGYRWRKYGQKLLKNSPYPRNYYRCSTNTCSVKKHTERSFENPSMIIITYQGKHNHYSHSALHGADVACFAQTPFSLIPPMQMPSQFLIRSTNTELHVDSQFQAPTSSAVMPHP